MEEYTKFKKRVVTPDKALVKLMTLCSRSEKSIFDARQTLRRWEIADSDAETILKRLVNEKYIDDRRYCDAYVREKSRLSNFGTRKIVQNLKAKRISSQLIEESISKYISKDSMKDKLKTMLEKKRKELERKEDDKYKIKDKLIRFAMGRGYDYDAISEILGDF